MTSIQRSPFQEASFQRSNSQLLESLPSINTAFYNIFDNDSKTKLNKKSSNYTKNFSNDIEQTQSQAPNTPPKSKKRILHNTKCMSKNENIIKKGDQTYKIVRFLYPLPENTIPFDVQIYLNGFDLTNHHICQYIPK